MLFHVKFSQTSLNSSCSCFVTMQPYSITSIYSNWRHCTIIGLFTFLWWGVLRGYANRSRALEVPPKQGKLLEWAWRHNEQQLSEDLPCFALPKQWNMLGHSYWRPHTKAWKTWDGHLWENGGGGDGICPGMKLFPPEIWKSQYLTGISRERFPSWRMGKRARHFSLI